MSDLMMPRIGTVRPSASHIGRRHWKTALGIVLRTYITRQALPELTARELSDIAVDRDEALAEAARLPWDTVPFRTRRGSRGVWARLQRWLERARRRRLSSRTHTIRLYVDY